MGQIIAFVPASGGVGATTLAAALAIRAAAASRSVVAVDLDPGSGGLDVVFGVEQERGWRWDALAEVAGVVDGSGLAARLPRTDGVAILATSRRAAIDVAVAVAGVGPAGDSPAGVGPHGAGQTEASATEWLRIDNPTGCASAGSVTWLESVPDVLVGLAEAHDLVVVDAPRDPCVRRTLTGVIDVLVLIVGTGVTQLAAASVAATWAQDLAPESWVVLRDNPGDDLADLIADELDLPVVAALRRDGHVANEVTQGVPPGVRARGPIVEVADRLLLRLAERAGDERVVPRWTLRRAS